MTGLMERFTGSPPRGRRKALERSASIGVISSAKTCGEIPICAIFPCREYLKKMDLPSAGRFIYRTAVPGSLIRNRNDYYNSEGKIIYGNSSA